MKNLQIQILLRLHGLQHVVDYLNLIVKEHGDLVLFKYNQIRADWSKPANLECRGLILDKTKDWKVVAYPYEKFFNIGEGYCAKIDWNTAKFYEKLDGSLINLYFYNGEWCAQTSGTIDASSTANNAITSFTDLVWRSVIEMYGSKDNFLSKLDINKNYMFELCTPENIVVTPHSDYRIYLHGVRCMETYNYIDIESTGLVCAKQYDIKDVDEMLSKFDNMSWKEEGFVVCDANFNRVKCKNPKYVAVHHNVTGVSPYMIINIIKTNEIDEFLSYFQSRQDEIYDIEKKWNNVHNYLLDFYNSIKHITDNKEFALTILNGKLPNIYIAMMFSLRNNKIKNIWEGMCKIENRYWYNLFK